jgi:hypothetical protein
MAMGKIANSHSSCLAGDWLALEGSFKRLSLVGWYSDPIHHVDISMRVGSGQSVGLSVCVRCW